MAAPREMTRPVFPAGTTKLFAAEKRRQFLFAHQLSAEAAPFAAVDGAAGDLPDFDGFVLRPEETDPRAFGQKRRVFASERQDSVLLASVDAERFPPDCPRWDQFLVLVDEKKLQVVG